MRIVTKFALNRSGFRDQILKDNGDAKVVEKILPAVKSVAPIGTSVDVSYSKSRLRIRIVDDRPSAGDRESKSGALSQALNALHV